MTAHTVTERDLKVLITVKTYPIPSDTYDELVCTAGVTELGDFVRLYPLTSGILNIINNTRSISGLR